MRTFKDATGREWQIKLSIGASERIKQAIAIDLLDNGQGLQEVATSPYAAANVLYVLCEKQCESAGLNDEQFGELLAGDVIDAATDALLEEIIDFFPKRQRQAMREMLAKMRTMQDQAAEIAVQKIQSQAMTERVQREMAKATAAIDQMIANDLTDPVSRSMAGGNSSGNLPASLAGAGQS